MCTATSSSDPTDKWIIYLSYAHVQVSFIATISTAEADWCSIDFFGEIVNAKSDYVPEAIEQPEM